MRHPLPAAIAAATAALAFALPAAADSQPQHSSSRQAIRNARAAVAWHRARTWHWQDTMHAHHTHSTYAEQKTRSLPYLRWLAHLWSARRQHARHHAHQLARQWHSMNRDFQTAVYVLAHQLHLTEAPWVISCARSEGGLGAWVPNRGGSGAGGWMQFLHGTYYNNSGAAWRFAQQRGVLVPRRYDSWYSPVGQALTALYMFHTEGSGQWYGAGC